MPFKCVACKNVSGPTSKHKFHRFPKDIKKAKKWAILCRYPQMVDMFSIKWNYTYRLCSDHFHFSQYENNHLIPNAMPSIFKWSVQSKELRKDDTMNNLIEEPEKIVSLSTDITINTVDGVTNEGIMQNMEDLCRLCAKNHECMISIYSNEDNINHNLESKIHKFLPFINLNESDLPKRICFICVTTVIAFNDLWETSIETNEKFNSLIFDTKSKFKVNQENNKTFNDNDDDHFMFMKPNTQLLTTDNKNQNTQETVINNHPEEIIEAPEVEVYVIETDSNTLRTKSNQKDDNQNCIDSSPILLDALMRPPNNNSEMNSDTQHSSDHTYASLPDPKSKLLWRFSPANKNIIDHTYAMWQWEKISMNFSGKMAQAPLEQSSFACTKCPASYSEKNLLTKHMGVMHKMVDHPKKAKAIKRLKVIAKCDKCDRQFKQQSQLNKHQCRPQKKMVSTAEFYARFRMDIDGQQVYKCDQCSYYTQFQKNGYFSFKSHYNIHLTGFDLMCDQCPKKFRTPTALKMHVDIVHKRIKKYACLQCGKKFGAHSTLKTHLLMHSGDRPYVCHECGKTFRHISKLRVHTRFVHQKEKNHRCPECDKPYCTATQVKSHILNTHTRIRDHVCQVCNKGFFTKKNLKCHEQCVHSNLKFICNLCDKVFKIKRGFILHCQKVHNLIEQQACNSQLTSPTPIINSNIAHATST